jgi:hypothetical protein
MNFYKVVVHVTDKSGTNLEFETQRNFVSDKDAYIYASGFAMGCASVSGGVVLDKQIEKQDDDRTHE